MRDGGWPEASDGCDAAGVMAIHTGEGVVRRKAFHDRIRAERDNLEAEGTALLIINNIICIRISQVSADHGSANGYNTESPAAPQI